jgi:outer membrane biosynthesis protein TonB
MKLALFSWLKVGCVVFAAALQMPVTRLGAAEPAAKVYEEAEVDKKPQPKRPVRPSYSFTLRRKIKSGEVVLRFVVTQKGAITNLTVVSFSDSDLIDPVYSAYESASYTPGFKDGAPVDTRVEVRVPFPGK